MELNEIITLINAGYTKKEIEAMSAEPAPEEPRDNEHFVGAAVDTDESNPAESGADVNAALMEQIKTMSATISGLTTTVKALQENNQKTATIPENSSKQTTEEIIKGFIENM